MSEKTLKQIEKLLDKYRDETYKETVEDVKTLSDNEKLLQHLKHSYNDKQTWEKTRHSIITKIMDETLDSIGS